MECGDVSTSTGRCRQMSANILAGVGAEYDCGEQLWKHDIHNMCHPTFKMGSYQPQANLLHGSTTGCIWFTFR